jgi:two-component system, cell cycle sensor histidine kinase and response regulator CckA
LLLACHGEEALQLAADHRDGIDLLLTDVVLPTMGGRDLADRYAVLCPNSEIVFMSGYTDDAIANHGMLQPGTLFIEKPFTTTVLLGKLREYLG